MPRTASSRIAPAPSARTAVTGLGLAAALLLSGCSADSPAPAASSSADAASVSAEHDDADVMSTQMMIAHHEQAVERSRIVLEKDGVPEDVRALAQQVVDSQQAETTEMRELLSRS